MLTATFNNSYWIGAMMAGGIIFATRNITNEWSWRIPSMVCNCSDQGIDILQIQCVPALLTIACLPYIPESPRWLFYQNRDAEVCRVMGANL
jgi:hypothetical protein